MTGDPAAAVITAKIGCLTGLPREELVEKWIKIHGHPPPKGVKRGLLERACAYQLQAKRFGGLKPATHKALLAIAQGANVKVDAPNRDLRQGTRLVREWHGVTHQVDVVEDGYIWRDQQFASLSSVAQAITGAKWSGPKFFGL